MHISICTLILIVIVARLVRRLAHPVAPECSLAPWQRLTSEAVHWLLYVLVLATTVSGWLFASARGWTISWFYMVPPPMLTAEIRARATIDGVAQGCERRSCTR